MGERWNRWRPASRGAGFGALGGVVATCVQYLYEQLTAPHPYNAFTFLNAPVYAILGAIVGLLVAAWYTSD
ncbi:MAG TPA: hypothetical protein VF736_11085 [Pyrinomonadaceae bacterium]|jgi:hypothetical protein